MISLHQRGPLTKEYKMCALLGPLCKYLVNSLYKVTPKRSILASGISG